MADITPTDIVNKTFDKSFRGYSVNDVDEFLQDVSDSLFHALEEIQHLRAQVEGLNEQVKRYQQMENLIKDSLLLAQRTAEERKAYATHEAESIRREAEERLRAERTETDTLRQTRLRMLAELRAMLNARIFPCWMRRSIDRARTQHRRRNRADDLCGSAAGAGGAGNGVARRSRAARAERDIFGEPAIPEPLIPSASREPVIMLVLGIVLFAGLVVLSWLSMQERAQNIGSSTISADAMYDLALQARSQTYLTELLLQYRLRGWLPALPSGQSIVEQMGEQAADCWQQVADQPGMRQSEARALLNVAALNGAIGRDEKRDAPSPRPAPGMPGSRRWRENYGHCTPNLPTRCAFPRPPRRCSTNSPPRRCCAPAARNWVATPRAPLRHCNRVPTPGCA